MFSTPDGAKRAAKDLHAALKDAGQAEITLTDCLEAVAQRTGYNDWHEAQARMKAGAAIVSTLKRGTVIPQLAALGVRGILPDGKALIKASDMAAVSQSRYVPAEASVVNGQITMRIEEDLAETMKAAWKSRWKRFVPTLNVEKSSLPYLGVGQGFTQLTHRHTLIRCSNMANGMALARKIAADMVQCHENMIVLHFVSKFDAQRWDDAATVLAAVRDAAPGDVIKVNVSRGLVDGACIAGISICDTFLQGVIEMILVHGVKLPAFMVILEGMPFSTLMPGQLRAVGGQVIAVDATGSGSSDNFNNVLHLDDSVSE